MQKRGWQVFAEYVDTGCSGASASRPQLDRLLRDARLGRLEAIPGLEAGSVDCSVACRWRCAEIGQT